MIFKECVLKSWVVLIFKFLFMQYAKQKNNIDLKEEIKGT